MDTTDLVGEAVRGVVALAVVGGYIYLAATGQTVPESFGPIVAAVVGFYFGAGGTTVMARLVRAR